MSAKGDRILPIIFYISVIAVIVFVFTGAFAWIYYRYTIPSIAALILLLMFMAWAYSNVRPAFPGKLLGVTIFYGLSGGMFRRFEALTTEMSYMLSDDALNAVKEVAVSDMEERLKSEQDPVKKEQIHKIKSQLEQLSFNSLRKYIHVYGCRRDFIKHVYVFVSEKSLEECMFSSPYTSFTIPFGYIRRQAVFGIRYDMKGTIKIPYHGKVRAHLFMPLLDPVKVDEILASNPIEYRDALIELGVATNMALHLIVENKHLRKELAAKDRRLQSSLKDFGQHSAITDQAINAASAKSLDLTEETAKLLKKKSPQARYYELLFCAIGGQILGAAIIPSILEMDAFVAGIVGSILGAALFMVMVERT
ncbi:MAG: hypothetical protein QXS29_05970 [Nitrososphaeria archaeon]